MNMLVNPFMVAPSFSPLDLFGAGEAGMFYDPSVLSSVWQDAARTVAGAVDAVVGALDDLSGNGNHLTQATTANKPLLRQSGSLYWLEFDGVDDYMERAAMAFQQQWSACAGAETSSIASGGSIIDSDTRSPALRHAQLLRRNVAVPDTIAFNTSNTAYTDASGGTWAVFTPAVQSAIRTGTTVEAFFNGASNGTTATTGTPRSGTADFKMGAREDPSGLPSQFWNGKIFCAVYLGRIFAGTERTDTEGWAARKSGATL